jgi:hypothetical protein
LFQKAQSVRRHFKVALFGRWKTGKTRAALSFPKPAVVDTHRGTDLYDGKYDFRVLHATTWKEMQAPVEWIQKNAAREEIETLIIDDVSTIYDDLIGEVSAYRQNKSGSNAPISMGDWGVIKRRWKGFLQMLLRLDVNVVLVIREKEEFEETTNAAGQEVRKKTGNILMDADRQTAYLFDFILYMYTEDNRKAKVSNHFIRVEGTRHHKLPKYSVHDITQKRMYDELFEPIVADVSKGIAVPQTDEPPVAPNTVPADAALATPPGALDDPIGSPAIPTPEENIAEIVETFGVVRPSPDQPAATLEEIKVLMTRGSEMRWPDDEKKCRKQGCSANGHIHPWFKAADAKSMIRSLYDVESSKELRRPQIDFLYEEFGKVLAGKAFLDRDGQGTVYIATPNAATEEEVRAKVLLYVK